METKIWKYTLSQGQFGLSALHISGAPSSGQIGHALTFENFSVLPTAE